MSQNHYICQKKMKLKLLYFGVSRDYTSRDEEYLEVENATTVLEMRAELQRRYPKLEDIQSFALAVNESYATDEMKLKDGDTVALIPPVSGG